MRRESFENIPSEALEETDKSDQEKVPEVKDNVVELHRQEPPAEHAIEHISKEAGSHDSAVLLSESEFREAQAKKSELESRKKDILRAINKGLSSADVKNLPAISQQLHKLESDIAFTHASGGPFKSLSKEAFDKLSPHEKSMVILREAGYMSVAAAEATQPPKDSMLARMIITAKKTASQAGIDVYATAPAENNVITPEGVWGNPPVAGESDELEESRRAA